MIYVYNLLQGKSLFPSPCGDYGSYRLIHKPFPPADCRVSVPLRGLWFLSCRLTLAIPGIRNVSVPLRGLWFLSSSSSSHTSSKSSLSFRPLAGIMVLIGKQEKSNRRFRHGFRPLAGIMVLIRTLYKCLYEAVEMAFCGADHIFSSFFVFCRKMIFKKLLRTEF